MNMREIRQALYIANHLRDEIYIKCHASSDPEKYGVSVSIMWKSEEYKFEDIGMFLNWLVENKLMNVDEAVYWRLVS